MLVHAHSEQYHTSDVSNIYDILSQIQPSYMLVLFPIDFRSHFYRKKYNPLLLQLFLCPTYPLVHPLYLIPCLFPSHCRDPDLYKVFTAHVPNLIPFSIGEILLKDQSNCEAFRMVRNMVLCLQLGVVSTSPNAETGGPFFVGCSRPLNQYISKYPSYLEAVPSPSRRAISWWQGPTYYGE